MVRRSYRVLIRLAYEPELRRRCKWRLTIEMQR